MIVIFDLDQTLINTDIAFSERRQRRWSEAYQLIPLMTKYPYIDDILQMLKTKGIKVAVVSSSPKEYCKRVLNHYKLEIETIVGYHDTANHKPHPDPYFKAIELLHERDEDVYAIGDDVNDVLAAKNAEIKSIGCTWGSYNRQGLKAANPDLLFGSPQDLLMFLQKKMDKL